MYNINLEFIDIQKASLMGRRIELRHLRYFTAVAEELHFRRAAERLNIAQPALSRTINQLEEDLGVRLFTRSNRQVSLTEEGKVFLAECKNVQDSFEQAINAARRASQGEIGKLRIGYTDFPMNGVLPTIIDRFRQQYPDIEIELVYSPSDEQIKSLFEQKLDFAFLTGNIYNPKISALTVQKDKFVAVLHAQHPLCAKPELNLTDLTDEPLIVGSRKYWVYFRRHLDALCLERGFKPKIVQEAHNSEGIFGFIAAKIGITILLESAQNYIRRGLVIRPLADVDTCVEIQAAWLTDQVTPVQEKMVDLLQQFVAET